MLKISFLKQQELKKIIAEGSPECGVVLCDKSLVFKTIFTGSTCPPVFATVIWYLRPTGHSEWPTAENVFDVLSGKTYTKPIVKTSFLFTPTGIWEITTEKHSTIKSIEKVYPNFVNRLEKYSELRVTFDENIDAFVNEWKIFERHGLKIWFTHWPTSGAYYLKSKLRREDFLYKPLSLKEIVLQKLPSKERLTFWNRTYQKFKEPITVKKKPRFRKVTFAKTVTVFPLKALKEKAKKTYETTQEVIKDEGLEWELFGIIGKTRLTKNEYLKFFAHNLPLQNLLAKLLDEEKYVTKDILMSNIYSDEEKLWELSGLQAVKHTARNILLDKYIYKNLQLPKQLLKKYSELLGYKRGIPFVFKEKQAYMLLNALWTDETVKQFITDLILYDVKKILLQRIELTGAKNLIQMGCENIEGINAILNINISKDNLDELLDNLTASSINRLHACLTDKVSSKDPKSLLVERIINAGVVVIKDTEIKNVVCNNIKRYVSLDEYIKIKPVLTNFDEISKIVPFSVQKIVREYTAHKLYEKSLVQLKEIASKHDVVFSDVFSEINIPILISHFDTLSKTRDLISKTYSSPKELYDEHPKIKEIVPAKFGNITNLEELTYSLSNLNLLEVGNVIKKPIPPPPAISRHKAISLKSYLSQIRLEERNILYSYFTSVGKKTTIAPALTVTRTISEEDVIAEIFGISFDEKLKKELDVFLASSAIKENVTYDTVEKTVTDLIKKLLYPLDINMYLYDIQIEKILQESFLYSTDFATELEHLVYYTHRDDIKSYIDTASKVDYAMTLPCFEWLQAQDDENKKEMIEIIVRENFIPLNFIPELIYHFTSSSKINELIEKDLVKHRFYTERWLLYGRTARVLKKPKYEVSSITELISTSIPLNRCLFKFVAKNIYIYDKNDLFSKLISLNPVRTFYSSVVPLISLHVVNDLAYVLQWNCVVIVFDTISKVVSEYKSHVVDFFKTETWEVFLTTNGELWINNKKIYDGVCKLYAGKNEVAFIEQTGEIQRALIYIYKTKKLSNLESVENFYTDFNHVYYQRGIETIISNERRICHKTGDREFVLDGKIAVLTDEGILEMREDKNISYQNCYDVYNNYIICKFPYVLIQTFYNTKFPYKEAGYVVIQNPDKIKFPYSTTNDLILALG